MKTSNVNFTIELDENHVPEQMSWEATDAQERSPCKAAMISVWDSQNNDTLRMDLWTKDMLVDHMKQFYHQTLLAMADSIEKSINEKNMADDLRDYCQHFAEKLDLLAE